MENYKRVRICAMCKTKFEKGKGKLFHVPKNVMERKKWSEICGKILAPSSLLCSDHFLPSSIINVGRKAFLLKHAEPFVQKIKKTENFENFTEPQYLDLPNKIGVSTPLDNLHLNEPSPLFIWVQPQQLQCDQETQTNEYSHKEQGTQTRTSIYGMDVESYFKRLHALEAENKELKLKLAQANSAINKMNIIFTEGQVRKMMCPGNIQWKWKDISSAICLHAAGPRAYHHLYKKGFPLPHLSTLQRWCAKVQMSEGVLYSTIDFMRQTRELTLEERICVLAFDEMKVAETFEYDPVDDKVRAPVKYVQVVMARGLKKSWKQPVFYDFDCRMTKEIIYSVIFKLYDAGFPVVAMVCDMGPTNRKLWNDLDVTTDKPWFPNPVCDNDKVFCFADAPHLLKLIRNHFLDTGLIYKNVHLTTRTIVDLMKYTSQSDVSITFKLSDEHVSVKGAGRQKVKLAAQLFSSTTANAITRCYSLGMKLYNPAETSDFIQLINDWFDILNSTLKTFKYPGKEPYGNALELQKNILLQINEVMSLPIIPGKRILEPFQKGVIMTNNALMMLHEYVKKFQMTYLVTNRLNQDVLEHFFGAIRSKGGLNDHPSPRNFKYRLRKYILARNTEHLHGRGNNVEENRTEWLDTSCNSQPQFKYIQESGTQDIGEELSSDMNEEEELEILEMNVDDVDILRDDALEYIAGYIIKKLSLEEYECHTYSFSWVDQVSNGSMKKPNNNFFTELKKLESIFYIVNENNISDRQNLQQYLVDLSYFVDLQDKIKKLFYKCRIYFRIRHLNKNIKLAKAEKTIRAHNKMRKTIT